MPHWMIKALDQVIWWGFVAILFFVPLLFWKPLALEFELSKTLFFRFVVLIICFSLSAKCFFHRPIQFPQIPKKIWVFFILYSLTVLISTLLSDSPHISFWGSYERQQGFMQFLFYLGFFLAILSFFFIPSPTIKQDFLTKWQKHHSLEQLIIYLCGGALLVSFIAILQAFVPLIKTFWPTDWSFGRIFGTMGQPNFLAAYLIVVLPFCFALKLKAGSLFKKYFWNCSILLILYALFLTGSKAGLIGLFSSLGFYIYCQNGKLFSLKTLLTILSILFLFIIINVLFNQDGFLSRFIFTGENFRSIEIRLAVWSQLIKPILARPWLGYGPEMFAENFAPFLTPKILSLMDLQHFFDRAHNEVLDSIFNIGLIGTVFYYSFFILILRKAFTRLSDPFVFAAITGLIGLFTTNLFGFSTTVHFILWWFLAGLILIKTTSKIIIKNHPLFTKNFPTKVFGIILSGAGILYLIITTVFRPLMADFYYQKALNSSLTVSNFQTLEYFRQAIKWHPRELYYVIKGSQYAFFSTKEYNLQNFYPPHPSISPVPDLFLKRGRDFLNHAKKLIGNDFSKILFLEAQWNVAVKEYQEALVYFEEASKKDPLNGKIFLAWAEALKIKGQKEAALDKIEEFLSILPYWHNAFTMERLSTVEKNRFRLFFKNSFWSLDAFEEAAELAMDLKDARQADFYKSHAEQIEKIASELP